MSITKSEAIVFLAYMTSESDGEFSGFEIQNVMDAMPRFYTAVKRVKSNDDFTLKYKSGELNELSAIETLEKLSKSDKLEALAVCWLVANADGVIKPGEKDYLNKLSQRLGINDFRQVIKKAKSLSRSYVLLVGVIIIAFFLLVIILLKSIPVYSN